MGKYYVYLMRERPPGPGAQPREGLVCATDEGIDRHGTHYWGTATYRRELTDEECEHYSMRLVRKYD